GAATRNDQVVVGAGQRRGRLEEHDRLFRDVHAALGGMVAVIQADAHDLARPADRWTEPRGGVYARGARGVARPGGEPVEAVAAKERLVVIATEGRCVDARSIRQLEAWTFAAGLAEANQLHARPTISREVGTHSRRTRAGSVRLTDAATRHDIQRRNRRTRRTTW